MTTRAADPVAEFEEARPRLRALAYRMLGSMDDAEDAVQETFVRWHRTPIGQVESPAAWLTTTCTRICIDMLRAAYRTRESYVEPWLPEPLVTTSADDRPDPLELADSLSTGFLLLLERLSPLERAAFLLHDVFDYSHRELAAILGRTEGACRQLVSRARRHLRRTETRYSRSPAHAAELLDRFLAAAREGDVDRLIGMLSQDAELWTDSGGEAVAARNVLRSADHVARFLVGVARKGAGVQLTRALVNGTPGIVVANPDEVVATFTVELDEQARIRRVFVVVSPSKLRRVPVPPGGVRSNADV
jgi:RNA polymerase sigma-70 factor, ECF subfamily